LAFGLRGSEASIALDEIAGRTVLLSCDRQLAYARALIEMDGIARRIVVCPPDLPEQYIAPVLDEVGAHAIVTDGTWPKAYGRKIIQLPSATSDFRISTWPMEPLKTEWVLFTSGTTGPPKMVVHTLQSLSGHLLPRAPRGRAVTWCTFYDVRRYGGLQVLLRALIGGGSVVLSSDRETPAAFLRRAAVHDATHFLGTPSHWRRALMTSESRLISPDYVRLSGEVADQAILDRLKALYPTARLVHAFASTETGVAFEVEDERAGFPAAYIDDDRSAGGVELRVRDCSLWVRSDRVAAGRLDGEIRSFTDADGFADTGDLVVRRGDRYHFVGRREGVVNVGGLKVHPEEVETVINRHPEVRMSLVRARANFVTGAVVSAEIVPEPDADPANSASLAREVIDLCRRELPTHKVPATVRIVESLEIAPSGKLVRRRA
jgi:acyl-CoA synthetase (AMP-forming)/AMP-acid ligase II